MARRVPPVMPPIIGAGCASSLDDKVTDLPMHGKQKELGTGLVNTIKKHLRLK